MLAFNLPFAVKKQLENKINQRLIIIYFSFKQYYLNYSLIIFFI